MNRTERAIKKNLRNVMTQKKKEKKRAIAELKDSSWYNSRKASSEVKTLANEEKGLREWHRKILNDACITYKEVITV